MKQNTVLEIKTKDSESQSNLRTSFQKNSLERGDSCRAQLVTPESHERDDGKGYWSIIEQILAYCNRKEY